MAAAALLIRASAAATPPRPPCQNPGVSLPTPTTPEQCRCVRSAVVRHQADSVFSLRRLAHSRRPRHRGDDWVPAGRRRPSPARWSSTASPPAQPPSPLARWRRIRLDAMIFSHRLPGPAHAFLLQFLSVEPRAGSAESSNRRASAPRWPSRSLETAIQLSREIRDLAAPPSDRGLFLTEQAAPSRYNQGLR